MPDLRQWLITPLLLVVLLPLTSTGQVQTICAVDEVLDSLELDTDQRQRVRDLHQKYKRIESMTALKLTNGVSFNALSTQHQQELRPRFIEAMVAVDEQALNELGEIMTHAQLARLHQLRVQALGPSGLLAGKLNEELGINDEQIETLRQLANEFRNEFLEKRIPALENTTPDEVNTIFKSELTELLLQELTDDQRQTYLGLLGEPVELPKIRNIR